MEDALYCRFNARGRKQFASLHVTLQEFARKYSDVAKVTLPAHKAAAEGRSDCLRDIYVAWNETGVASRDVNGATPLHVAARTNRVEIIKWLLRYTDLSPLTIAKRGETPVHVAVAQGHIECLKALLDVENKASVLSAISVATDNNGLTPLHVAIMMHRRECAIQLFNDLGFKGASNINESGITCCHIAAAAGNLDVLKHIAQKHKKLLSQEAADGATPIYYAAQEGQLEAVTFLHSKGKCSLDTRVSDGMKPIHAAAQSGHTHIVQYIVCQTGNSSMFDVTDDGGTPLHFAAVADKENTARWLIRTDLTGTLIHKQDLSGNTPVHDAAEFGNVSVLKLLLDCGADLYAKNNKGHTPYLLATNGKSAEMKAFVLSYAPYLKQKASTNLQPPVKQALQSEQTEKQNSSNNAKSAKKKKSKQGKAKAAEKDKEEQKSPARKLSEQPDDTAPLEIDEEDFRLFRNEIGSTPKQAQPSVNSDLSEIVVRYTDLEQANGSGEGGEGSDPVEIGIRDTHRKSVRSIRDAIHSHGLTSPSAPASNELGFGPQFRSNPLVSDPHILAMAEQLQAQSLVQSNQTDTENKLQGKGTSSSSSLHNHPTPHTENPPTPPSTPLAATSTIEVLQTTQEADRGNALPKMADHSQSLEGLMAVLQSTPQDATMEEEEDSVAKDATLSPVDASSTTEQHLLHSAVEEMQTKGTDSVQQLNEGSTSHLIASPSAKKDTDPLVPKEGSKCQLQASSAVKLDVGLGGVEVGSTNQLTSTSATKVDTKSTGQGGSTSQLQATSGIKVDTDLNGTREGSTSQLNTTSTTADATQSTIQLQANLSLVGDINQPPSVQEPDDADEAGIRIQILEPTSTLQQDSSANDSTIRLPGNVNLPLTSEPTSMPAVQPSATNEPHHKAHSEVKPEAVQEPGNRFNIQLRKRSQDPTSQPKNKKPTNDIQSVQLRKISQEVKSQPEKPMNDIMAVQLRKAPQKQNVTENDMSKENSVNIFNLKDHLKHVA